MKQLLMCACLFVEDDRRHHRRSRSRSRSSSPRRRRRSPSPRHVSQTVDYIKSILWYNLHYAVVVFVVLHYYAVVVSCGWYPLFQHSISCQCLPTEKSNTSVNLTIESSAAQISYTTDQFFKETGHGSQS